MKRFTPEARDAFHDAVRESQRRGDRHVGTEHLLLGVLAAGGPCAEALELDLAAARAALLELDRSALAAVGVVPEVVADLPARRRGRTWMTSGAKAALGRATAVARDLGDPQLDSRHLAVGILDAVGPDPALVLLRAAGVDVEAARTRLAPIASGGRT